MEPAEREQGARDLAAALQRNTNIETLELEDLEDIYTVPILEGLRSNVSVKTFIFSPGESISDAALPCIQHLLESTTSIQRFELHGHPSAEISFAQLLKPSQAVNVCLN